MANTVDHVDQFNLKWGMHYPNFIECFSEYRKTGDLIDMTLSCEGKRLGAHRLILASCSGYFQTLFRESPVGFDPPISALLHPVVVLPGKYEHLKAVVDFIYEGEVKVLDSDLRGVLELGELLQVKGLNSVKWKGAGAAEQTTRRRTRSSGEGGTPPVVVVDDDDTPDATPPISKSVNGWLEQGLRDLSEGEPSTKKAKESTQLTTHKTYGKPTRVTQENVPKVLPEDKRPAQEIPQVVNPFMLFANGFRNKVAADHPEEDSKRISIRLSQMWNTLSAEVKEPYYETARKAQEKSSDVANGGESEGELKIDESVDTEN